MGDIYYREKKNFYMHLKFIGLNIQKIYNNFKNSPSLHEIIKLWDIDSLEDTDLLEQINEYFDFLQNKRKDEDNKDLCLKECLIIKINNIVKIKIEQILFEIFDGNNTLTDLFRSLQY